MHCLGIISITFIFVLFFGSIYSFGLRRYPFEGVLYAELYPDTKYVRFSKSDRNEWKNLTNLVNSYDLNKKGIFCSLQSRSGWIAYPEANYFTDSFGSNEVTLLIGEGCIETDSIESIQPILPLTRLSPPTLVVFKNPNFIGFADALDLKQIELGEAQLPSEIGSLILFGSKSWTLQTRDKSPRSVCIFAGQYRVSGKDSFFCPIQNLEREFNLTSPLRILRGCTADTEEKVEISRCYSEGDHILWTERGISQCKQEFNPVEIRTLDEFVFLQYIWYRRMNLKANSMELFQDFDPHDTIRFKLPKEILYYFEVLELCVEFTLSMCREDLNDEFWFTLRETVMLQISILLQDIQRDFYVNENTFQAVVNFLSVCKENGNLSSFLNKTVFDVVEPSTFLPTTHVSTDSQESDYNNAYEVGNETTSTTLLSSTAHIMEGDQLCTSHTDECDRSRDKWDNMSFFHEEETNSSFLSEFIQSLVKFISVKCTNQITLNGSLIDSKSFLNSTILLPLIKQ